MQDSSLYGMTMMNIFKKLRWNETFLDRESGDR